MGNTPSHPPQSLEKPANHRRHSNSPSPLGNGPHRSLRTKKKSLELPDLASLSLTPHLQHPRDTNRPAQPPPKSASIPIPTSPEQELQQREREREKIERGRDRQIQNGRVHTLTSAADVLAAHEPSTHLPFPPPPRPVPVPNHNQTYFKGSQRGYAPSHPSDRQQAAVNRLQRLYNEAQSPAVPPFTVPPPSPNNNTPVTTNVPPRKENKYKEVVHSSIPLALPILEGGSQQNEAAPLGLEEEGEGGVVGNEDEPVPVRITWRGGGRAVLLARAGDDDWKGRLVMERESPSSQTFFATVTFPPGTHHFRFLVDEVWRVSDAYPTAVDDQGSLANYVNVVLPPPSPVQHHHHSKHSVHLQQHSVPKGHSFWSAPTDGDGEDERERERERERELRKLGTTRPDPNFHAKWTSELPQELIEAAREEEAYLLATSSGGHHQQGFTPAPNIPPAPGLPRYLDKLILNNRVNSPVPGGGSQNGSPVGKRGGRDRERERERERERKESRRDGRGRGRDREGRSGPPPAPPPSEVGDWEEEKVHPVVPVTVVEETLSPDESPVASTSTTQPTTPITSSPVPPAHPEPPHAHPLLPSHHVSGSRAITLDATNMPPLTDDASVLPVPSHVVLHHLSTSAIKNGVLAVGNTTRYRKKFLTTIYYKPT